MVVDVSSTTSVSVRKAFEDRNAITVGSFDFSFKKKNLALSRRLGFHFLYAIFFLQLVVPD